jgi:SAM-dependent methyltransferase
LFVPQVLVKTDELFQPEQSTSQYDRAREISKYLLMHYGSHDDVFDRAGHPLADAHGYPGRLSDVLRTAAHRTDTAVRCALDVGCNVGGVSHALSTWVADRVVGVDISTRSVEVARALTVGGGGVFSIVEQGPLTKDVEVRLPGEHRRARVEFEVGDGAALRPGAEPFDAVLLSNVLDRVADPAACLAQFSADDRLLRAGGLLMIACPWSWYPEYSGADAWLGSARDDTSSEAALKNLLSRAFTLLDERDEAGVLRQNSREYDYFEAHVTVWQKR